MRFFRKSIAITVALSIVVISIIGCAKEEKKQEESKPSIFKLYEEKKQESSRTSLIKAPNFLLPSIDGKKIQLSDYAGNVVIINFWTTWCKPCTREIPSFVKLQKKYKDKPFTIIGISLDNRISESEIRQFTESYGINYPIALGMKDQSILTLYGRITSIPTTFIIDKKGYIRKKLVGYGSEQFFDEISRKLLAEKVAIKS